jgi:hypothetical protein
VFVIPKTPNADDYVLTVLLRFYSKCLQNIAWFSKFCLAYLKILIDWRLMTALIISSKTGC